MKGPEPDPSVTSPHVLIELVQAGHKGSAELATYLSTRPEIPAGLRPMLVDEAPAGGQVEEVAGGGIVSAVRIARVEPCHQVPNLDRQMGHFLPTEGRMSWVGATGPAVIAFLWSDGGIIADFWVCDFSYSGNTHGSTN